MPKTPIYEAFFSRSSAPFSGDRIVYTEDGRGSSPLSPTIQPLEIAGFGGHFTKCPVGSMNRARTVPLPLYRRLR